MAAVQTQNTNISSGTPLLPTVSPEVREQLSADRRRMMSQPEQAAQPVDLSRNDTYLFRTKPGKHKGHLYELPMKPEEIAFNDNKVKYDFHLKRWGRLVAHKFHPEVSRQEAMDLFAMEMEDLRDRMGDTVIRFQRVGRAVECVFGTEDDTVAAFVRKLMATKPSAFWYDVYEESGRARVIVGDKAFPNTTGGWAMARAHAAANNIEDIKLVKE